MRPVRSLDYGWSRHGRLGRRNGARWVGERIDMALTLLIYTLVRRCIRVVVVVGVSKGLAEAGGCGCEGGVGGRRHCGVKGLGLATTCDVLSELLNAGG